MEPITAIASITLPPMQVLPAEPPHTYMGIAYAMLPGAQAMATTSPLAALPLAMVCAHALECMLKAFLSRSGDDHRVKQRDFRHNLNALWALSHSGGLKISSQPQQWVECLSLLHNTPYFLRYSTGVHCITTPAPEPMLSELTALIELIRGQLQP